MTKYRQSGPTAASCLSILTPLLCHLCISEASALLLTQVLRLCGAGAEQAAAVTGGYAALLGNLLVLPLAIWMYRKDRRTDMPQPAKETFPFAAKRYRKDRGPDTPQPAKETFPFAAKRYRKDGRPDTPRSEEGFLPTAWMYRKDCGQRPDEGFSAVPGMGTVTGSCGERTPEKRTGRRLWVSGLICFAMGGLLNVGYSAVLDALHVPDIFSNQAQEQLLSVPWAVQVLGLGILAPVTEELIFRGLTYRRMRQVFAAAPAVLLSSVLFALYHGNPIQIIFAFPMAVILAVLYERGKLFLFPVLFHMGSNLTAVFWNFLS